MFTLVGFHECRENVQAIALGRAGPRRHQSFDLRESLSVISFRPDRSDVHSCIPPLNFARRRYAASDLLRVDEIVLTVRASESDADHAIRIVDPRHDAVFGPRDRKSTRL